MEQKYPVVFQKCNYKNVDGRFKTHTALREYIKSNNSGSCDVCKSPINIKQSYRYHLDHKIPICLGGSQYDTDNCQLLCNKCNLVKTKYDKSIIVLCKSLGIIDVKNKWGGHNAWVPREKIIELYKTIKPLSEEASVNTKKWWNTW